MRSKVLILLLFLSMGLCAQTRVIAHRGFWNTVSSAQNSLVSIRKADSIGCYGSEFDIWITSDDKVMVNHDGVYQGVVLEASKYNELKDLKLNDGEKLPTLESYLKQAKKLKVQLILEVKQHRSITRQNIAIDKTLSLVKKMGLTHRITYISFSLDAVKRLMAEVPRGTEVYYLNGTLSPLELKSIGCTGPDYYEDIYKSHPDWIDESHRLGLKVNVWTVDKAEDMKYFINKGVEYITTNNPLLLQSLLR
jgi:glycerophosphoryl diester phosphodiesterase